MRFRHCSPTFRPFDPAEFYYNPDEELPEPEQPVAVVVFEVADGDVSVESVSIFDAEWVGSFGEQAETWIFGSVLAGCAPHLRNPDLGPDELRMFYRRFAGGPPMRVECLVLKMGSCSKGFRPLPGTRARSVDCEYAEAMIAAFVMDLLGAT